MPPKREGEAAAASGNAIQCIYVTDNVTESLATTNLLHLSDNDSLSARTVQINDAIYVL